MPIIYSGTPYEFDGESQPRFGIVVARYNENITEKLLDGATATLLTAGIPDDHIEIARVPGAWELPVVADRMVISDRFSAVICLGAVIRGETSHDQHINRQVSLSLGELSIREGIPILFGLLTCESMEQAIHRSGGNVGNKGAECADAALEMVSLLQKLDWE